MSHIAANEIVCLRLMAYLPGCPLTEDELYKILDNEAWFGSETTEDPRIKNNVLQDKFVVVARVSHASPYFDGIAETEINDTSLFDTFDPDGLWDFVKPEFEKRLERHQKEWKGQLLIPRSQPSARYHIYFSMVFLVRAWYDYDSYTMEAEAGVDILRVLDLNKLPDLKEVADEATV